MSSAPPAPPTSPRPPPPSPRPPPDDDDSLDTVDDATHRRVTFEPGAVVNDRFALRRPLGEGALGASWLAHDRRGGSLVVLKVVGDMLVTNDRERADLAGKVGMFAGRLLAGVVMPREVFAVPGSVVVVYPYVEAVSLRAVIDARHGQGARFTPEECLRVAQALVASVQAMHAASPHGALWPQNVLVTARGLLLVDGLLATAVAPDRLAARVEHQPSVAPFCAPELASGRRPTASADLYGVGAILAELAGGAPPGSGPELAAVSHDLHRAVATLLDREPARRPAGIRMVLDALTVAAGFAQRPTEAPLPLPDSVLAAEEVAPDPPTLPPSSRVSDVVIFAAHAPATESPPAPQPQTADASSPDGPPGRLRGPTATLPLMGARSGARGVQSGPPPSLSVKSGPPSAAPQPVAPQPVAPQPIAPQPAAAKPAGARLITAASPAASGGSTKPAAPPPAAAPTLTPKVDAPRPQAFPIPAAPAALTSDGPADPRTAFKTLPSIREAARGPKPVAPREPAPAASRPAPLPPRPIAGAVSAAPPAAPLAGSPSMAAPPPRAVAPLAPAPSSAPPAARPSLPRPPPPATPAPARAAPPAPPAPAASRPLPPAPPSARPSPPPAPTASVPPRVPPRAAPGAPRDRSFDDDGIDPKLLRVARMLDDERRREASSEGPPPAPPRGRPAPR